MSNVIIEDISQPLRVVAFGPGGFSADDAEMKLAIATSDLIVALGGVELDKLAKLLPVGKTALCVLSSADIAGPAPRPFVGLHGKGISVDGWRISGVSGSPLAAIPEGFVVSEEALAALLEGMPGCEVLLSATPPAGYDDRIGDIPSYETLRAWAELAPPYYHLFGHPLGDVIGVDEESGTMLVGVHHWLALPPLLP